MKEIVGAMIGTKITNNPRDIAAAVEAGTVTEFLDRNVSRLTERNKKWTQWIMNLSKGATT